MMMINCEKTDCKMCNFHHCGLHDYNKAVKEYSRPKGEWLETKRNVMGEGFMWKCSVCGNEVYVDSRGDFPKYCDECGADMRGE